MKQLRYTLPAIILTALMHAVCCLFPLVALLLGSGSWLFPLRYLTPYKPYLIALNLLLLGWAFYRAYGTRHNCVHRRQERVAVWIAAIFSVGVLLAEPVLQPKRDEGSRLAAAHVQMILNTRQVTLQIEPATTAVLSEITGVLRVEQTVPQYYVVRYNRTETSVSEIIRALRQKGCRVQEMNPPERSR